MTKSNPRCLLISWYIESCGVADLITTCSGGRNRKVAAAFIKSKKTIDEIEKEMLNGQKLQGTTTSQEVYHFLSARNMTQA
jgi:glycerol-3-phosphate dehydrogenase (NAD+)